MHTRAVGLESESVYGMWYSGAGFLLELRGVCDGAAKLDGLESVGVVKLLIGGSGQCRGRL
jgi:hypothetical protein